MSTFRLQVDTVNERCLLDLCRFGLRFSFDFVLDEIDVGLDQSVLALVEKPPLQSDGDHVTVAVFELNRSPCFLVAFRVQGDLRSELFFCMVELHNKRTFTSHIMHIISHR